MKLIKFKNKYNVTVVIPIQNILCLEVSQNGNYSLLTLTRGSYSVTEEQYNIIVKELEEFKL